MVSIRTIIGENFHLGSVIKKKSNKILGKTIYSIECEDGEIVINREDMKVIKGKRSK